MPFIILIIFALILLQGRWPGPPSWLSPGSCALLVGAIVVSSWLFADLIARVLVWQLHGRTVFPSTVLKRYTRWRRYHFIGLLTAYLVALYLLGWGQVLENAWGEGFLWLFGYVQQDNLPGLQVGLILPLFVGLVLGWERFYQVEKTAFELGHGDDHFVSRRSFVVLQVRHHLLFVLPPILVLLVPQILLAFIPDWSQDKQLASGIATLIFVAMFLFMPVLLRVLLGLKPLPPGPLRDRLDQAAHRLRLRYSNVLVWNTRNLFANALVTGFVPWLRYIVLTDRLIDKLEPEEVEAVFGHEIGHIKHRHLFLYATFFLTSFILLGVCWDTVKIWLNHETILGWLEGLPYSGEDIKDVLKTLASLGKLGLVVLYTLFVFGFLSRRCERQADLFGCEVVSTEVFISALEKVADINGIPRHRAGSWFLSWQHPSIAQRIDFLEKMRDHPEQVKQFNRSITMLRWGFVLLLLGLVWYLEVPYVWNLLWEF